MDDYIKFPSDDRLDQTDDEFRIISTMAPIVKTVPWILRALEMVAPQNHAT